MSILIIFLHILFVIGIYILAKNTFVTTKNILVGVTALALIVPVAGSIFAIIAYLSILIISDSSDFRTDTKIGKFFAN